MASKPRATKSGATKRQSSGTTKRRASTSRASSNGHVRAPDAVKQAIQQLRELTGRPVEGVLGVQRDDDGWVVTVEVVELRRVPDSTDVLGSYAVAVDSRGELQEYRRTHRYYRSQVEEG